VRRNGATIIVVTLCLILAISFVVRNSQLSKDKQESSQSSPAPSATQSPAYDTPEVQAEKNSIRRTVRSFVLRYYSYEPGLTWSTVRQAVKPKVTVQFLSRKVPPNWLPVDDLSLGRSVRVDVEAALSTLSGEYFDDTDTAVLYTSLGVTTYNKHNEIRWYKIQSGQLRLDLRRVNGRWRVDDLSLTD